MVWGSPFEDVEVVHGDTAQVQFGIGTFGSRSAAVGGMAAVMSVNKIEEKAKKIAAFLLEAAEADLVFEGGQFFVKGTPGRGITIQQVAFAAYVPHKYPTGLEPGLEATSFYDPSNFTWPFGSHVAVVEVDPETGVVKLRRYVAVDDCGRVINPLLVDGQIHGGLAQGIAQALYEEAVYDENGQLVSGSLMDYAVPKADDLVNFELDRTETPSPVNALGVKGIGEAGNDRLQCRDRQRRGRRPGTTGCETSRHAAQTRAGVAGDPASPGKEVMAMPATSFEYHAPTDDSGSLSLLTQYGGEAKILAGGHSLLPIMNLRLAQPKALIDIGKISGLSGIREENGTIVIGAMTTHYMVESSSLLKQKVPILPETAAVIGDVQVRNRGTIGGSIAHADPAGDLPPPPSPWICSSRPSDHGRAHPQSAGVLRRHPDHRAAAR